MDEVCARRPTAANPARRRRAVPSLALAALAIGCGVERVVPPAPVRPARVYLRGFSEATPVRAVVGVPPFALAIGERGLERWDLRVGTRTLIGEDAGLPPGPLVGHALVEQRRALWLATEAALARYDVDRDRAVALPPPTGLAIGSLAGAHLAAATDGGVWVGLPGGLFHVREGGGWRAIDVAGAVTAVVEVGGDLWIGTDRGLAVRDGGGAIARLGRERGCDLSSVSMLAAAPEGGVVAVGVNEAGAARVALARGGGCDSYRVSPARAWQAIVSRAGEVVILADRRVSVLARPPGGVRRLARDGMRLLPVPRLDGERPRPSPFSLTPLDVAVPSGARSLGFAGGELLIGTDGLGIARWPARGGGGPLWLRARELTQGARSLSVACRAERDCWLATGGPRAWRFDGEGFRATVDDGRAVLAVVGGPDGAIHGLVQDGGAVAVVAPDGDGWRDTGLTIESGGARAEVGFARRAPAGAIWLGLRARDGAMLRPAGVAIVDPARGAAAIHKATGGLERGVLPLPPGASEVAFRRGEAWLVSADGVVRLARGEVERQPAPPAELRGLAFGPGGRLYAGSRAGALTFDGRAWSAAPRLGGAINDLAVDRRGRLWLATDRGLVVYDGERVRRLDRRRGLLEDRILDLEIDDFGRVWLRGAEGIALVTP